MTLSFLVTTFHKLVNVTQKWDVFKKAVMNPILVFELTTQLLGGEWVEGGVKGDECKLFSDPEGSCKDMV
jgi:hypothetical protein